MPHDKTHINKNSFLVGSLRYTGFALFLSFIWIPEIHFICNEKRELLSL